MPCIKSFGKIDCTAVTIASGHFTQWQWLIPRRGVACVWSQLRSMKSATFRLRIYFPVLGFGHLSCKYSTAVSAGLGWVASYINQKLNRKIARKTQHMLYFWKVEGSRMSNMTFPCVNTIHLGRSPFSLSPQCQKSSLCYYFMRNSWKLGSHNLPVHTHFWCTCTFSFS